MKVRVASDLHFEFMRDHGRTIAEELVADPNFDVLVVAGDLCSLRGLYGALITLCLVAKEKPVVYVMGNHDAYGGTWKTALDEVRRAEATCENLTVLEEDVAVIGGQRFVGCTLWFEHDGMPDIDDRCLGDFHYIKDIYGWIAEKARTSVEFLTQNIQPGDIVVTHHLPSHRSVHERYRGSSLNKYFVHNVEGLIRESVASLWIHGHTHSSCDYMIGKTRVVCNPFGYAQNSPGEPNPQFNSTLTVEGLPDGKPVEHDFSSNDPRSVP